MSPTLNASFPRHFGPPHEISNHNDPGLSLNSKLEENRRCKIKTKHKRILSFLKYCFSIPKHFTKEIKYKAMGNKHSYFLVILLLLFFIMLCFSPFVV